MLPPKRRAVEPQTSTKGKEVEANLNKKMQASKYATLVPGTHSTTLVGNSKCERCGQHMLTSYCSNFIKEAGLQCHKFEEIPDTLRHYRTKYHYRCPWAGCTFHVLRNLSLSFEQREELVWKHERECKVERTPRTELTSP